MSSRIRLLGSVLVTAVLVGAVWGASSAFFTDTETSTGNVMQAGGFDLLINGQNKPSGIVTINDLKPGDNQIVEKVLRLNTNPGRVWMHLKDLEASQGAQTEPEDLEENGEPKFDIENYIFYDLKVDGTDVILLENEVLLPEAVSCWIPLGEIPGETDIVVEQSFHFDADVTNWAQGDLLTFTEEFWAIQDRNNDQGPPPTEAGRIWDPEQKKCVDVEVSPTPTPTEIPTPTPTPLACVVTHASSLADNQQGLRKNGTAVLADRSNPSFAFGAPQTNGTPFDSVTPSSFFSLGFAHTNNSNTPGSIVLGFASPFFNGPGDDLKIFEVTGGTVYPDEKVKVEVGPSATGPWTVLTAAGIRDVSLDLGLLPSAQFVKLTDVSDIGLFESTADGYDLDAVRALCGEE